MPKASQPMTPIALTLAKHGDDAYVVWSTELIDAWFDRGFLAQWAPQLPEPSLNQLVIPIHVKFGS